MRARLGAAGSSQRTALQVELRIAAYLARKGQFEKARRIILDVRDATQGSYSPDVFCAINFAEGAVQYFEHGADAAIDKFLRSAALSAGCPTTDDLPSLVLAWIANCRRLQGRWSDEFSVLKDAIVRLTVDSAEVLERICLIISDSLQEIRQYADARAWYEASRKHALLAGDDSAISAILYNRTALGIFNARIDRAKGLKVDLEGWQADIFALSAENYTHYVGEHSMTWVFDLMKGQLHLLRGDFAAALELLDRPEIVHQLLGWPAVELVRRSDVLLACAHLSKVNPSDVVEYAKPLLGEFESKVGSGDLAIAAHSLLEAAQLNKSSEADDIRQILSSALDQFETKRALYAAEIHDFMLWLDAVGKRASLLV